MKCVSLAGDGIGPEIMAAVHEVLDAACAPTFPIDWLEAPIGATAFAESGLALPSETVALCSTHKRALKAPTTTALGKGERSANVGLRKALDLYANLRPVKSLPRVPCRYQAIDLVIVRENTEDLYAGLEHTIVPGVVESLKIITEKASTRIARFAYEYARAHGRKRVDIVHKANIMKLSDGLFLDTCRAVAKEYPEIETRDVIVDALCMHLVKDPYRFDVLLLPNLYGDIVSDLCAGLVGGLGVVPGANIGESCAVFEAVHGSAPDIAGRGIANPTALLRSAVMMLDHAGAAEPARRIEAAIEAVYTDGRNLTPDVGGSVTTQRLTRALIEALN